MAASASSSEDEHSHHDMEEDESDQSTLQSLILRYRFTDHKFPWKALQAAGWKYKPGGGYVAPMGRLFPTAEALCAYMDRFAIPDVYSNLESFDCRQPNGEDEETTEGKRLRHEALEALHQQTRDPEWRADTKGDDDDDDDSPEIPNEQGAESRPRRSIRDKSGKTKSATTSEKGSDLYLHRKTRGGRTLQKKSKHKQQKLAPTPSAESLSSTEEIVLPTLEECVQFVEAISQDGAGGLEEMENRYERHFGDWRFLLSTNHSLLLFGAGSKFNLINSFCDNELNNEGYSLIINGFDKNVSVDGILDLLVQLFLDNRQPTPANKLTGVSSPKSDPDLFISGISNPWRTHALVERAIAVGRAVAANAAITLVPIFLVIHNLEGLRKPVEQQALSSLLVNSTVPNGTRSIRLVASVDHVDSAACLWDLAVSANFSWIWKEVHTHRPYHKEFAMLTGEDTRKKTTKAANRVEEAQEARVLDVLKNIAPRHAEVVQILATLQLEQLAKNGKKWVDYFTFRDVCKARYVVNKDSLLQPFLMELKDHRLITSKMEDGCERLSIPYSTDKLNEILAYKLNGGN